ncbi:phage head closure protein [Niameybacter massiliensis]|uniref:Phage head closure protein n=1 Tax=Holtiella tumoricola TaxID=3018743 RepID=A0AA42DNU5_9FIRM|nr:phage head closure protein [Holtiella tumoricola]MDA3732111.1 phage head closure protein [Holtiella tumoricola]
METGKRNRRITVLEYQEFKDEEGVYVKHWGEMCRLWAYIKPMSGSQVYLAQAGEHKATVKINIRYNRIINESMRIQIGEELYSIGYIEDVDFAHREMWLTLEKVI